MNEELASLAQRHLRGMSEKTTKARVLRAVDEDTGVWGEAGGWWLGWRYKRGTVGCVSLVEGVPELSRGGCARTALWRGLWGGAVIGAGIRLQAVWRPS